MSEQQSPAQEAARRAAEEWLRPDEQRHPEDFAQGVDRLSTIILSAIQSVLQPWVEACVPIEEKASSDWNHHLASSGIPDSTILAIHTTAGELRRIAELVRKEKS